MIVDCAGIVTCIFARSQMADAFLRKYRDQFEIYSTGLEPKKMSLNTVRVMQEVGIDISGQKPTSVF